MSNGLRSRQVAVNLEEVRHEVSSVIGLLHCVHESLVLETLDPTDAKFVERAIDRLRTVICQLDQSSGNVSKSPEPGQE